ncbi:centromere protein J isoform X1 [Monomorium pharaonis]|uniref:centromere protein J isoform X1 n=1 Tax=Monomorium pharaonis TaxID=307658 RepID=UPI0017461473|nr:centromere protein J isoform X1 [Monomorium pharaonis]XP_036150055.1 centromere protein J isoform X1 [Monomorium pharaonis]
MDIETCIDERLQKLRQWQIEQQERLLKQQQMQREILSHEQDRVYKVLGLSMHNSDIIENTKIGYYPTLENTCVTHETEMDEQETMSDKASMLQCAAKNLECVSKMIDKRISMSASPSCKNCDEEQSDDSNCTSTIINKSGISMKDYNSDVLSQKKELSDSLIEGVKPLSSNDISNKRASIDDILLSSSKKDFQTLLEEKLKKESEITLNTNTKIKPKKPFLKKGQGLLRFKMSTNPYPTTKRHNIHLPSNTSRINKSVKSKKSVAYKHVSSKSLDKVPVTNEKQQINLKTVPSPKKISSKSTTSTNRTCKVTSDQLKCPLEMNISDCDSKAEKELEEVRIFELLEEKAENSSFCSTSSTVLAFLQQSTPFKVKDKLNQIIRRDNISPSKKHQNVEQTSDMIEQESTVAHPKNLKSSVQYQVEQFEPCKHSHATIDSYYTIDNTPKKIQNHFIPTNRVLRKNEVYKNHPENHDTRVTLSDSDEERDISMGDNLMHDSETDANHHVRFSEYNEYRTIDSSDMSDTMSNSLKDYLEQQNWNSVDTLELSDVKKKLPHYEEQILDSLKIVSDERAIDIMKQLPLQRDVTRHKDLYTHVMETICVSKEKKNPISLYKNELPDKEKYYDNECIPIIEKIVQISDEEQSVLSSSLSLSSLSDTLEVEACDKKEYVLKSEPKKLTEEITKVYSNVGKKEDHYPSEERSNQTFETELLKSRLLELEKEINIFRKESSALLLQRRKLQEDETILHKQYAEKEKNFEETKRRVQNQLEEEKKVVAREKIAMENRIRDAQEKARQSKLERQKVQNLQEQLEQLRDELNIKESRWNAAESRYKSELRVLRVEISKLKQEISNLQNTKKINIRNVRKSTGQVITKAINQINKRVIVAPSKEMSTKVCQDLLDTSIYDNEDENDENKNELVMEPINVNDDFDHIEDDAFVNKIKYKQVEVDMQAKCNQKFLEENVEKKRHLYENLLKDATSDLMKNQNPSYMKRDISSDSQPPVTHVQNLNAKSSEEQPHFSSTNKDLGRTMGCVVNNMECCTNRSCKANQDLHENDIRIDKEKEKHRMLSPEKKSSSTLQPSSIQSSNNKTSIDAVKQIQFSDGRIEYWYSNGNVKKIFPDQEVIKMIYYNGDVRETDKNGKVKYFYAATRTWHTTMSDGLEILEFPDGQVEKRMSDGTVEVLFPDGTVAQTFINGDKILSLPNGQREIHTKAHKRREYPDGTVKLIYADGTQETRYSSGRKRLKDKDGNLLMDSYDV